MSEKIYSHNIHTAEELAAHIQSWLSHEKDITTRTMHIDTDRTLIQADLRGGLVNRMIGSNRMINLFILACKDCVKVELTLSGMSSESMGLLGTYIMSSWVRTLEGRVLMLANNLSEEIDRYMS